MPIDAADGSVFNVYDTINVRGVDGYASDGSTVTPGVDLMLYVVALDASSGLPVVVAINGKKQNPADVECYVPSIPEGTALYCMAKAGSESQLFCPPTNQAPTPREVYMQRKMSNTKFTEYFENVKKKVAWDKEDVMENDLWEFRRKCEVSYLLGIKGKIAIKDAQYPFGRGRYEIQAGEGRKLALTLEQIGQIANYEDGTEATAKYRDYWLFLYLCNGINVADFVKLRYRDIVNGEICFVRQKTERTTKIRKEIRVVVTERMQAIINRWGNPSRPDSFIFPILDGQEDAMRRKMKTLYITRAINKRMKEVGEQLGIGNISTYTARHSFATVLKRAGTNIAYISESLGHQDLKTTENYLASFEREERVKNAKLLTKF